MTDPFATADDAAGYAYALPDDRADGLLARATQALIDAAGFGILSASATVRLRAEHGMIRLDDVPLVTDVTAVALVHDDGTTEAVTDFGRTFENAVVTRVWVMSCCHHRGLFAVTLTQGLASVPDSLKLLTCAVAYRVAAMPAGMSAGFTSQSVGGVSWSASKPPADSDLTPGELSKLGKIVPVRRVTVVPA